MPVPIYQTYIEMNAASEEILGINTQCAEIISEAEFYSPWTQVVVEIFHRFLGLTNLHSNIYAKSEGFTSIVRQ